MMEYVINEKNLSPYAISIKYYIEDGCWICSSHKEIQDGYFQVVRKGKLIRLHRYTYQLFKGNFDEELIVRHTCDNNLCINPEHLILGTDDDNVRDRVERNRSAIGVDNGRSKLNEDDVRFIRKCQDKNNTELGKMFNVDRKSIRNVKDFITWQHVV